MTNKFDIRNNDARFNIDTRESMKNEMYNLFITMYDIFNECYNACDDENVAFELKNNDDDTYSFIVKNDDKIICELNMNDDQMNMNANNERTYIEFNVRKSLNHDTQQYVNVDVYFDKSNERINVVASCDDFVKIYRFDVTNDDDAYVFKNIDDENDVLTFDVFVDDDNE